MTRIIAHRGNLCGPFSDKPNYPKTIESAIDVGFDVEVDLRYFPDDDVKFKLGHDFAEYDIPVSFLYNSRVWVHCKDILTFAYVKSMYWSLNSFFHDNDSMALTTNGYIWIHPRVLPTLYSYHKYDEPFDFDRCIAVLPEELWKSKSFELEEERNFLSRFGGICTDYPVRYREEVLI